MFSGHLLAAEITFFIYVLRAEHYGFHFHGVQLIMPIQRSHRVLVKSSVNNLSQALVLTPILALTPLRTLDISLLDNKDTTVNGVDDNKSRLKGVRGPSTSIPQRITTAGLNIIRRVDVKVRNFLDLGAVRVTGNGGHVEDTETGLVVGLVVETVVNVLVVVNGTGSRLVVTGNYRFLEVLYVPDV